ncbi:GH92 family glycosyl hydrolase [Sunxiuqinia sp. sy24]|uniref:GH92 family glycosyl hydrolase n=1 Tax=Sunxiuqinia sp. sy24 TaxID=3461495 RepID=UPI0040457EB2
MKKIFFGILALLVFSCVSATSQNYAKLVDTKIGSEGSGLGCGYNYIGASYPFGMVQFTPSFFSPQRGFVITQLSGAGCSNMGNFPVLPLAGSLKHSPNNMDRYPKFENINDAHAGYLSVEMKDKSKAELTVNERSGIAKFCFDDNEGTVIIGAGVNSTFVTNARVQITSDYSCEGFSEGGEFCGTDTNYRIYFAAEFNRPAKKRGTWIKHALLESVDYAYGENSGAYFTFDTKENEEVTYRIAISFVSVENAKQNLEAAGLHDTFEEYRAAAEKSWNENLGKIAVTTDNEDRKVQFYTHLYHSLIHPNIVSDVNGEYMGADYKVHKTEEGRDFYSSFSVWDTYRTQAQLLAMLYPKESSDMMQSLIDFADQCGGYGRWILANIETGIMQGDATPTLISNSYAFGATNFDVEKAYKYMKRGATIPLLRSQEHEIRPHLAEYIKVGLAPASMLLEYASSDYAIGQFAKKALGNTDDALFFTDRAQNWKNLYNPEQNWLQSRHANGKWKKIHDDWRESTYKNYFWMVPFNLECLIDTMGGKDAAEQRLDILFKRLDAGYDDDWFAAGNEPDFQVPWIYNWTNSPYKTSEVIHRILTEMYSSKPFGLPGNDDLGTMGAWYVFASIGIYPMIPGVGVFSINAPQFKEVKIDFPEGELVITGGSVEKHYIQTLKLNGENYKSSWIDWKDLKNGAMLDFKTSKKVQKNWGLLN